MSMLESHSFTLRLPHSQTLTLSLSHSLTLDMLNNFCFHLYSQNCVSCRKLQCFFFDIPGAALVSSTVSIVILSSSFLCRVGHLSPLSERQKDKSKIHLYLSEKSQIVYSTYLFLKYTVWRFFVSSVAPRPGHSSFQVIPLQVGVGHASVH